MQAGNHRTSRAKGRLSVVAACALLAGVPSASFAIGSLGSGLSLASAAGAIVKFTPASVDPRIAELLAHSAGSKARLMRFTPAGVPEGARHSVTVAVRVDEQAARAISAHAVLSSVQDVAVADNSAPVLRLAPMRYNLGLARGYQSFAKVAAASPVLSRTLTDAAIPDLATYRPSPGAREHTSRFTPHNPASELRTAAAAPKAIVDTREASADQPVDVSGSYRLTHNFNVTAGLRYSQERDRLAPVADTAKQDNQAVYVGTQFRF